MLEPRGSLSKSSNATDLLRIHYAELHEVTDLAYLRKARKGKHRVADSGSFAVCEVRRPSGASTLTVEVGNTLWALEPDSHVVRVGDYSFCFPRPELATDYVVVLAATAAPEALGILESLLAAASLYNNGAAALEDVATQAGDACASLAAAEAGAALGRTGSRASLQPATRGLLVETLWTPEASEHVDSMSRRWRPTAGTAEDPPPLSLGFRQRLGLTTRAARRLNSTRAALGGWFCLSRAPSTKSRQQWEAAEQAGMLVLCAARQKAIESGEGERSIGNVSARMDASGAAMARAEAKGAAADVLQQLAG